MHAASTALATVIASQAEALGAIIASITGCVLMTERIRYRIVQVPPLPAATGGSIKRQGAFIFGTSDTTPDAVVLIPGIIDGVLLTTGPLAGNGIDTTNGDVIAFIDEILAIGATNPFADAITALNAAYLQSRS